MQGLVLSGKYRLLEELGQGGMGSVWKAQHLTLGSPVAIKLIDPFIARSSDALARFHREARAAATLRSPHVVQILDHGVDAELPFIVMELMEGETLGKRLQHRLRLEPHELARIVTHVSRALTRAHEAGIVHRDLKPENVFLVRNDDDELAKVLDFGIAKASLGDAASTRTGAMLGTPHYMSPEQALGERSIDLRSDLWSLAVIAYECLLGRRPFEGASMGSLLLAITSAPAPVPSQHGAVPAGFDGWFQRGCARDRSQRFASAKEAALELRRLCGAPPGEERVSIPLSATVPMSTLPASVPVLASARLPSTVDQLAQASSIARPPAPAPAKSGLRWLWLTLPLGAAAAAYVGWRLQAPTQPDAASASLPPAVRAPIAATPAPATPPATIAAVGPAPSSVAPPAPASASTPAPASSTLRASAPKPLARASTSPSATAAAAPASSVASAPRAEPARVAAPAPAPAPTAAPARRPNLGL